MKKAAYQVCENRSMRSKKLAKEQAEKEAAAGIKRDGPRVDEGELYKGEEAVKVEEVPTEEVVEEVEEVTEEDSEEDE